MPHIFALYKSFDLHFTGSLHPQKKSLEIMPDGIFSNQVAGMTFLTKVSFDPSEEN